MAVPIILTDTNGGEGYNSDCTDVEMPNAWCSLEQCGIDPSWTPHPEHLGPGRPQDGNYQDLIQWELNFDGDSPSENFFKILADDDGDTPDNEWYYVTVVPPLSEPILGDGASGTELDKAGRYKVLINVNPDRIQWWHYRSKEWRVFAAPLP